jgi:deoxyribodipyrimidine photo-lyase
MRPLIWFRNDLRIADNPALAAASASADAGCVAVFLHSPHQWQSHDWGAPKVDFILRQVAALAQSLSKLNIPLQVIAAPRFADAPAALLALAKQERCDLLAINREYEVNELARDAAVAAAFTRESIDVKAFHDQTILPPDALRTGSGQFYRVFTPFKNAWMAAVKDRLPIPLCPKPKPQTPSTRRETAGGPGGWPEAMNQGAFITVKPVGAAARPCHTEVELQRIATLWPAGEAEAHRRLRHFTQSRIRDYKTNRDFPALPGTSALSPYLSAGVLSPRQCLLAALDANDNRFDSGNIGITTWISELIWREFYRHVMLGFPRVCKHLPFRSETRRIKWSTDDAAFNAWATGRTGVPIVDAAQRQLLATGWMHNRLRMITAMFLTKDLFIDWRRGERFFMQHLVDADLAQNNGGWQWSASTGTDAAPYFRIFNPLSQSRRFDPQGAFIRQYCPELRNLDDDNIHDPSGLPPLTRATLDYPQPIADHKAARDRAIAAFKSLP